MKRILLIALLGIFLLISSVSASGEVSGEIEVFFGDGCSHCADAEAFLDTMEAKYPDLEVKYYEVWNNKKNAKLLAKRGEELNIQVPGVPVIIIGDEVVIGYSSDAVTGAKIERLILKHLTVGAEVQPDDGSETIKVPFLGERQAKDFSLPVLTAVIGILDGFNPCAMWVLIFLITLLLGMKDRKRMWILGGAFILTSGTVYFLFLSAWLKLFLFIGFTRYIQWIVGIVAIASGLYHLREYQVNKEGECKVTKGENKKKMFDRLKDIVSNNKFMVSLIGIILLAAAVNLVELVCSAGLPAVYIQVLVLSELPAWKYYGYLLLYIFFFTLDDMIVFVIAMVTLKMTFLSGKYTRWSNLIGGVIILIIGLLLIFAPGWLSLG